MEDEDKRVLCDRLASLENELQRRDDTIQSFTIEKAEILDELKKSQERNHELHKQLGQAENSQYEVVG